MGQCKILKITFSSPLSLRVQFFTGVYFSLSSYSLSPWALKNKCAKRRGTGSKSSSGWYKSLPLMQCTHIFTAGWSTHQVHNRHWISSWQRPFELFVWRVHVKNKWKFAKNIFKLLQEGHSSRVLVFWLSWSTPQCLNQSFRIKIVLTTDEEYMIDSYNMLITNSQSINKDYRNVVMQRDATRPH